MLPSNRGGRSSARGARANVNSLPARTFGRAGSYSPGPGYFAVMGVLVTIFYPMENLGEPVSFADFSSG
jgi:hypothetical protein